MFSLIPWRKKEESGNPLRRAEHPLARFRDEFDSLFDRFFGDWPSPDLWGRGGWGLDSEETDKEYVFRVDAPGFEAGDFDVQVTGNTLHIRAEHREGAKEGEEGRPTRGRRACYERRVTLPAGADLDKVEAHYRNGVLEVYLPKTPEALGRRIEVKS